MPFPVLSTVFAAILFYVRPESLPVASGRPGIDNQEGYQKAAFRAPYPFQVNSPSHLLSRQGFFVVSCAPTASLPLVRTPAMIVDEFATPRFPFRSDNLKPICPLRGMHWCPISHRFLCLTRHILSFSEEMACRCTASFLIMVKFCSRLQHLFERFLAVVAVDRVAVECKMRTEMARWRIVY